MKLRSLIPVALLCATACFAAEQASSPTPPAAPAAATSAFRVHVLPPGAYDRLNLSPDQAKAVAVLEANTTASLETILTPDQLAQLKQMRPGRGPRPGGPNGGGQGMPPPPPPGN